MTEIVIDLGSTTNGERYYGIFGDYSTGGIEYFTVPREDYHPWQ